MCVFRLLKKHFASLVQTVQKKKPGAMRLLGGQEDADRRREEREAAAREREAGRSTETMGTYHGLSW